MVSQTGILHAKVLIVDDQQALEIITHGDGRTEPGHFDPVILGAFKQHHDQFRAIFEACTV